MERRPTAAVDYNPMRKSLPRLLVVLALALTVPIQGVAAVSAGLCMALGHHGGSTQGADHHHADGADHHHADGAAHQHGESSGTSDKQPDKQTHCPPCVSCCASAAIVSYSPFVVDRRAASSVAAAPSVAFSGVAPETLDRPPLAL